MSVIQEIPSGEKSELDQGYVLLRSSDEQEGITERLNLEQNGVIEVASTVRTKYSFLSFLFKLKRFI